MNIAVVGATGLVGRTLLTILKERGFENANIFLFASKSSEGRKIKLGNHFVAVNELNSQNLTKNLYNFVFLCTKEEISKNFAEIFVKNGACVIDLSSYFRKDFPLIVPCVNGEKAKGCLISNPNCSTAISVVALNKIHKKFGLKQIIYTTFQAVSGAGDLALKDFNVTKKQNLNKLDFVIKNNLIPYIGNVDENGVSQEESKMNFETKKILNDFNIKIFATCVRVPITIGHSVSITFKTEKTATLNEIMDCLKTSPGITVCNCEDEFPMPVLARHKNNVFVGRVRKNLDDENSFSMFVCGDNLRRGAALNAVEIMELKLKEII